MIEFRPVTSADVPAMTQCRAADHAAGPADPRMAAYLDGRHHPQQALQPRTAFVALEDGAVVGYIAGHATTRYRCSGEVQYLYVAPSHRRRGVARGLLLQLAAWFQARAIHRVCVNADVDSPGAVPFYVSHGATPINPWWFVWDDVTALLPSGPDAG